MENQRTMISLLLIFDKSSHQRVCFHSLAYNSGLIKSFYHGGSPIKRLYLPPYIFFSSAASLTMPSSDRA